jgi:hypothetical protein
LPAACSARTASRLIVATDPNNSRFGVDAISAHRTQPYLGNAGTVLPHKNNKAFYINKNFKGKRQ